MYSFFVRSLSNPNHSNTLSGILVLLAVASVGLTGCDRAGAEPIACGGAADCPVDASVDSSLDATPSGSPDSSLDSSDAGVDAFVPLTPDAGDASDAPDAPPSACGSTMKLCGWRCVDIDDPAYGCTPTSCAPCALIHATATCSNGACDLDECAPGYANCVTSHVACATSITTAEHCGDCTTSCGDGGACVEDDAGTPSCTLAACPASAPTLCGDTCVDTQSDPENCGRCGVRCSTSGCADGECVTLEARHVPA